MAWFLLILLQAAYCLSMVAADCTPSVTTASGSRAPKEICSNQLIFEENFEKFDFKTWSHENTLSGGGNWEFQWYTNNRTNSFVKDGNLYIKPSLTSDIIGERGLYSATIDVNGEDQNFACTDARAWGCSRTGTAKNILNPIRSAKVTTIKSFAFNYGRVEIRAKMPTGDWLWPAIWMLSVDKAYGNWPSSGEIDLVEGRGNSDLRLNGKNIGTQLNSATLHWGPDAFHNQFIKTHFEKDNTQGYNNDFHLFQMEWTPSNIKFSIDDQPIGTVDPQTNFWDYSGLQNLNNPWKYGDKMAPFDQQFYFIINLAVGGVSFFPDEAQNPKPKPWLNTSPKALTDFWAGRNNWLDTWKLNVDDSAALQVDYIKVWAL